VSSHSCKGSRPVGHAIKVGDMGAVPRGSTRRGITWMAALFAVLFAASLSMAAPSFASAAAEVTAQISHLPAGNLKTGEQFTAEIKLKNTGDAPTAPGATPTDALGFSVEIPESLEYISATPADPVWWSNPQFPTGCFSISLGATQLGCYGDPNEVLAPGETSPAVNVKLRVKPSSSGTVDLNVSSLGGGGGNVNGLDSFQITPSPSLSLDKSHSGLFKRSSQATYDLTVTNDGPLPTTGTVIITDELPAGLTYDGASSTGNYWSCADAGQVVTCTGPAVIASGESAPTLHLDVNVDAGAPSEVTNTATVTSTGATPGEASDPTPIYSANAKLIRYSVNPTEVASQTEGVGSFFRLRNLFNDTNVFLDFTQLVNKPVFTGAFEPGDESVSIDPSGVDFPTYTIPNLDAGLALGATKIFVDVDVDFVPTGSWTGSYDPATGESSLNMKVNIVLNIKLASLIPGLLVGTCETGQTDVDPLTTGSLAPPDPDVVPSPVTAGQPFGADSNGALINNSVAVSGVGCPYVNPLITALAGLDAAGLASAVNGLLGTPAPTGATDIRLETHAAFPEDNAALTMKVAPVDKIVLGTGGAYKYDIVNESSEPTDGSTISVTNTLPDGLAYVDSAGSDPSWNCSATGQDVTCDNNGTYAAGETLPTLRVNVSTTGETAYPSVANFASVEGGGSEGEFIASHMTKISAPGFALAMTSDTGNHNVGSTSIMRPGVRNSGTEPTAGEITLVGTLPRGMTYVSAAGTGGFTCTAGAASATGQTVTCKTSTPVAAGATVTPQITVAVNSAAADSVSTSWAVSGGGAPAAANSNVTSAVRPVVQSELSVTSTHTGDFAVGAQGEYTIVLKNTGLGTTGTNPVTVTTNLPDGLRFVSASPSGGTNYWQCSASGQTVECGNTTPAGVGKPIAAGGSATPLVITVDVENGAYPSVTNRVTASGGAASNVANGSDPTNVTAATTLGIIKSHEGKFTAGEDGSFNLEVYNSSPVDSSGTITVSDTLPAGLTFVSADSAGGYWSCDDAAQVVTCTSEAVIPAGDSAPDLTITTGVGEAAVPGVTNTGTVSGGGMSGDAESSDSVIVDPAPPIPPNPNKPILSIDKSHQGDFKAGQSGEYRIVVSNDGEVPTSGTITATDALPIGLTYESAAGDGWNCSASGQKVNCTSDAVVAAGADASAITLKVKVDGDAAPGVTNTASVQGGGAVAQAIAYDPTKVQAGSPKITAVKVSPAKKSVKAGKAVTLTVKVTNGGDAAASGVSVCASGPAKKVKVPGCTTTDIAAGATSSVKLKVKAAKKAKGKATVKVTAKSGAAGSRSASSKLTIKK